MILKIKLQKVEYYEFVDIAMHYFHLSKTLLNSEDYLHYYNLKSIVEKCLKKQMFEVNKNRKLHLLSMSVNEYESFKYIYKIAEKPNDYTNVVIMNLFTNLDKQIIDNNHYLICTFNGKKEYNNNGN